MRSRLCKFQTSIPSDHISKFAKKGKYQKINTKGNNTQLKMANKLILSFQIYKIKITFKKK